jgi:hypothetical protein
MSIFGHTLNCRQPQRSRLLLKSVSFELTSASDPSRLMQQPNAIPFIRV